MLMKHAVSGSRSYLQGENVRQIGSQNDARGSRIGHIQTPLKPYLSKPFSKDFLLPCAAVCSERTLFARESCASTAR